MEGGFGDYKAISGRAFVSGEIADRVYGKVAVSSKRRDTYLVNNITRFPAAFPVAARSTTVASRAHRATRCARSFGSEPRDDLDINLTLHASTQDSDGAIRHFISGVTGAASNVLYNADSTLVPGYANDSRNVVVDDPGEYRAQASGANLRFDVGINEAVTFTSLTAYRYGRAVEIEPGLGTPALTALRLDSTPAPSSESWSTGTTTTSTATA